LWSAKYKNNKLGVSGILVLSERGETVVKEISKDNRIKLKLENLDLIYEGQINDFLSISKCRKKVLKYLVNDISLIYILYGYYTI